MGTSASSVIVATPAEPSAVTVDQVTKVLEAFDKVNFSKLATDLQNAFKDPKAVIADVEALAPILIAGVTIANAPVGAALGTGLAAAKTLITLVGHFWPAVMLTTPPPAAGAPAIPPHISS